MKPRPVLRYFGGKFRIATWVVSHFTPHKIYVEPFGGAASVLLRKPRSKVEVYNDLDDSVYSLFKVLQMPDSNAELQRLLEHTPFARREFELAHVYHPDPIEKARRLIVRSFMGFGADSVTNLESKTGFRSNSNRSNTVPAHDWVNYPGHLPNFLERLKGVIIENQDAFKVMLTHDTPQTLHYLDPPYPHTTRRGGRYKHEMCDDDHRELCGFVPFLKGKVVISGYSHPHYDRLGWMKVTKKALADGAGEREECLWIKP